MPCWPSLWALSKLPVEVFVWTQKCGYGSPSAAPEAQPGSAFSEMPPPSHSPAPALEEVGEGADKGNCCPQSVVGETERGTGSNLWSEPRHLPLAEGTHWAWNTPAHTCTQPWQRPCPSTGCATETGLQNYPGELFIPISQFLFSQSHAF